MKKYMMMGMMVGAVGMYTGLYAALQGQFEDDEHAKATPALFRVIKNSSVEGATQLLESGVDIEGRDGIWGYTPLLQSLVLGRKEMAEMLLERRANAGACSNKQFSALFFAGRHAPSTIETLLEHGAVIDKYAKAELIRRVGQCDSHAGIDAEVTVALIKHPEACDQEIRQALLRKCYLFDSPESETLLADYGNMLSEQELMALLRQAVIKGNKRVTQKLADVFGTSGNYIYYCEGRGDTLLLQAVESRNVHITRILLAAGHDPNTETKAGRSPLVAAVEGGDQSILYALLRQGARLSKQQWRAMAASNQHKLAQAAIYVFQLQGPMSDDHVAEYVVRSCPVSDCVLL